jgi:hypothetical protein
VSDWEVPVPFSDAEMERLSTLAAAERASVAAYIRLRVFGPSVAPDAPPSGRVADSLPAGRDQEWVAFYDRLLVALTAMRTRALGS